MKNKTNETDSPQNKPKRNIMKIISLLIIAVGLALFIVAAIMEANNYPWGILFGTSAQSADSIPDPSPIVLSSEDQGIAVTAEDSTAAASGESSDLNALPGDEDIASVPSKYVILGTLKIPVLNVSQNLLEGAGKEMKYGVGHVPTTAAPGQAGNCAIAGHRPYPFRYLDLLKSGDKIIIKSGDNTYTYTVYDSFDVLPDEVWVLKKIKGETYTLTLITCTPYLVSSHRLIIRARLTDVNGLTPQAYYAHASPEASASSAT